MLMLASAQYPSDDPARPSFGKEGQVFTVKFVPGNRLLEVRLVDKPLVQLEPGQLKVLGRVFSTDGSKRTLTFKTRSGALEIVEPIKADDKLELEIKDTKSQKSEKMILIQTQP